MLQPALYRVEGEASRLGQALPELAWVLMEQPLHKEKDGHVVIFKRPLPD